MFLNQKLQMPRLFKKYKKQQKKQFVICFIYLFVHPKTVV